MCHSAAVDRLAQLVHAVLVAEFARAHHVADQVVALDGQRRIIAPLVRIADLHRDLRQLGLRLLLGFRAHPVEGLDALLEGQQEVVHHLLDLLLALGREVVLHIDLADHFAQVAVDLGDRALVQRTVDLGAAQHGAAEGEALVDERLRQVRRVGADQAEGEVGLPGLDRGGGDDLVEALQVGRLADDHLLRLAGHAASFR
jgi:hypothetical protein